MIRKARPDDYKKLLPLFKKAHAFTVYRDQPMDELHLRRMVTVGAVLPAFHFEVVEIDGELVGMFGGMVDTSIWGSKRAVELMCFSDRSTHRLIRNFEKWAASQGIDTVILSDESKNDRYRKMMNILGYNEDGVFYSKKVI